MFLSINRAILLRSCQQTAKENSTIHFKQTLTCNYVSEANANIRDLLLCKVATD